MLEVCFYLKDMSGDREVEMHLSVSPLENVTLHESLNAAI